MAWLLERWLKAVDDHGFAGGLQVKHLVDDERLGELRKTPADVVDRSLLTPHCFAPVGSVASAPSEAAQTRRTLPYPAPQVAAAWR